MACEWCGYVDDRDRNAARNIGLMYLIGAFHPELVPLMALLHNSPIPPSSRPGQHKLTARERRRDARAGKRAAPARQQRQAAELQQANEARAAAQQQQEAREKASEEASRRRVQQLELRWQQREREQQEREQQRRQEAEAQRQAAEGAHGATDFRQRKPGGAHGPLLRAPRVL